MNKIDSLINDYRNDLINKDYDAAAISWDALRSEFTRLESENAILTGQHAMMHTEIELLKAENEELRNNPIITMCIDKNVIPYIGGEPQYSGMVLKINMKVVPVDKDNG